MYKLWIATERQAAINQLFADEANVYDSYYYSLAFTPPLTTPFHRVCRQLKLNLDTSKNKKLLKLDSKLGREALKLQHW